VITLPNGQELFSVDLAEGPVGVVVYPWEVLVGRSHEPDSALNVIEGEIRSLVHVGNRVRVRIGDLTAEVTEASAEKLGLEVGTRAVASFKATGTRLVSATS
jgi:molybdopterin-binding protein